MSFSGITITLEIETDWKPNWYGLWADVGETTDKPTVESAIDPNWFPADKNQLIAYLERSPQVIAVGAFGCCRICKSKTAIGYQSDGDWVWEQTLAHYVSEHQVVLPIRFADHMRQQAYRAPEVIDLPVQSLPWPEGCVFLNPPEPPSRKVKIAPLPKPRQT